MLIKTLNRLSSSSLLIIVILSWLLLSCASTKIATQPSLKSIPKSFNGLKDSINSSSINWKNYFTNTNLTSLIDTALSSNFDLMMSYQKIEMARAQVKYSKGLFLPYVNGVGSVGQRRFGKHTMDGVGNYDTKFSPNITKDQIIPEHLPDYYLGLQTSWEIDAWGKLRNKRDQRIEGQPPR